MVYCQNAFMSFHSGSCSLWLEATTGSTIDMTGRTKIEAMYPVFVYRLNVPSANEPAGTCAPRGQCVTPTPKRQTQNLPSSSCKKLSGGFTYFIVETFNFQLCLVHLTVLREENETVRSDGITHLSGPNASVRLTSPAVEVFDVFDK